MNTMVLGFLFTAGVFVFAMDGKLDLYFQAHSLVLVCGGTLTILFFMTPMNVLKNLAVAMKGLFHKEESLEMVRSELAELSANRPPPRP